MVEQIIKIGRILSKPYGHGLIVAIEGSGIEKQVRLSCYINDIVYFETKEVDDQLQTESWPRKLQRLQKLAGLNDRYSVLFLSEEQLTPDVLGDVSSLINNGEVQGVFSKEDLESTIVTKADILKIKPVQENLEMVLREF